NSFWMVTLKAHILPHHDLQPPGCRGSKGYVHGHSAGGTNPSLVEAMHFGKTVIAFDCGFNRHTTGNEALYFNNAESLFNVINNENVPSNGEKMIAIAQKSYTWDIISKQYKHLFTMSKNKK
ncbi:hypothetical protein ABMY54_21855, partial [Escherichia coli]